MINQADGNKKKEEEARTRIVPQFWQRRASRRAALESTTRLFPSQRFFMRRHPFDKGKQINVPVSLQNA